MKVFCASWAILSKKSKPYMLRVRMVCWRFLLSGGEFSCLPPGGLLITVAAMGRGYVLATVGIIVGGLTDHVYFNTQMGLCFWTLGGLTMLCKKLNEEDD